MQRLITQPVPVTVSGRRVGGLPPATRARRGTRPRIEQRVSARRAAKIALGVILACATLGLLGAIDNVVSASADGSHHPVSERAEALTLLR